MKLLIIRHGDPDYSIDSLTETGWQEAELLVPRMKKLDIKAIYCSPMGRAKDTASCTLKVLGREAEILPWLREFSCRVEIPGREGPDCMWDWLPINWMTQPLFYDKDRWLEPEPFNRDEIRAEVQWVRDGLDALLAKHGYRRCGQYYKAERSNEDTVVLFCHFGLECVLLSHLLGISPMVLWHGTCAASTSVTTLVTEERRKGIASWRMSGFGDISHLYAAGREPSLSARFCETYENWDQRHD